MRRRLQPHPDFPSVAIDEIEVRLARTPDGLSLRYVARGDLAAVAIPLPAASGRADELWRHTCFELFVRVSGAAAYREHNFSPSRRWAAYDFTAYRAGMAPAAVAAPGLETSESDARLELRATIALPEATALRLALSAVIEAEDGSKSYWALAHPPGAPDFHHSDCFALELPAARRA